MDNLFVNMKTIDDKTMFSAKARENPEIVIDYFPPVGTGCGYTSLELLMASFGSCLSTTLLTLLRYRMKKQVDGISVVAKGSVREEHPKVLEHISLVMRITARDLSEAEAQDALQVAESGLCPVWAMIKGYTAVDVKIDISE